MATLVLEIDDDLRGRIEARARTNHRSLEEEAVDMMWNGLLPLPDDPSLPAGERIARATSGSGLGFDDDFQNRIDAMWRDQPWRMTDPFANDKDSAA